jgi:anti-anti-sigma factor
MAKLEDGPEKPGVERSEDETGAPVFKLSGEIDMSNADALGDVFEKLIGDDTKRLVVDLTALEFMDSAGIAMLLRAAARVETVELRNPSNVMRRIIECTGLAEVFHLES